MGPVAGVIGAAAVSAMVRRGCRAPGEAAEVATFPSLSEFLVAVREFPIDAVIVSANNRRKRLLVADMDSTMIVQECIDELAAAAGIGREVSQITTRAMAGELDFDEQIVAAVDRGRTHVYVTKRWRLIAWLIRVVPDAVWGRV